MKVLLVDADSTIPNIPLMKLSTWHKNQGDTVHFHACNLPYYPNKKRSIYQIPSGYAKVYCSVIFEGNRDWIKGECAMGGTGSGNYDTLPLEIENGECDYSLYPENDISYGFISRGCIRKCSFCSVPAKEGGIRQVFKIKDIVRHKKVKFLDNNFLALPNCKDLLHKLKDLENVKMQFIQGLDIRLLNREISFLLSQLNYLGDYIFAFDNFGALNVISEKLELLYWREPFKVKFYMYVHPDMPICHTVKRIEWAKREEVLPYIMRDISCWGSEYSDFYVDIAAYCNQPAIFKKMDFADFLRRRAISIPRKNASWKIYQKGE